MKQHRSPPNNSNGIFSVSFSYRSPIVLRSFSVRSPFILRSFSVHSPFVLRSGIGERTENKERCNDYTSVLKRRDSEKQTGNQQYGSLTKL